MVGGEFVDRLAIKKTDRRPGGEIKLINSSGFVHPKLEELFWRGEGVVAYKKEDEKTATSAYNSWLKVRAQDVRNWLIEEIDLQDEGKDSDLASLKEIFIKRLKKVIEYYKKNKKDDVVENLTKLIEEL